MNLLIETGLWDVCNRWSFPEVPKELQRKVIENLNVSKGQLHQDIWASYCFRRDHRDSQETGFFVEFGATDGVLRSNTYLLEKTFGWKGILCEPARAYHESLRANRNAAIDHRCVFSETGSTVEFHEVDSLELSGIRDFKHIGGWEEERSDYNAYEVETVSLYDLLTEHNAPKVINYMSIDTEGSEFEILRSFDFNAWRIETLSIEHNYSENEEKIDNLLSGFGYERTLKRTSGWDSWYELRK
jgi:FkbM family methyltransferase